MQAPGTMKELMLDALSQIAGQIKLESVTTHRPMRIRASRLFALGYRRLYRETNTVDRWEREGWDFVGVPIFEDDKVALVKLDIDAHKRDPLKTLRISPASRLVGLTGQ